MSQVTSTFVKSNLAKRYDALPRFIKGASKLPKDVILHYLIDDGSLGPRASNIIVKDLLDEFDSVYVYNVMEVHKDFLHGRRIDDRKLRGADKKFLATNRHFHRVHDLEKILQRANAPLIFNYNHILDVYKVDRELAIDVLYRAMGNFATLWDIASRLETTSLQLIPIRLPRIIKDITDIRTLIKRPNKTNLLSKLSKQDVYLYSLIQIIYADGYSEKICKGNVVFRLMDGINHVDIPYRVIAREMDEKASTPETRLADFYKILDAMIALRVSPVEEEEATTTTRVLNSSAISIKREETDILDTVSNIELQCDKYIKLGVLTKAEAARNIRDAEKFKKIEIDGKTIGDILKASKANKRDVPPSTIPEIKAPIGDSIKCNTVQEMDRSYIRDTLEQDLIENIAILSRSGHIILNVKKVHKRDAATDEVTYSIQTRHVKGSVGTMTFTLPKFKEDGTFRNGGVDYRMGKQRSTLPIIKISKHEVAMTSGHSKMFASVGRTAADNIGIKLNKHLNTLIIDDKLTEYTSGNDFLPNIKMGLLESALFEEVTTLKYNGLKIDFKKGHTYNKDPVKFNETGDLVGKENYGNILDLLDIPKDKMGKPFSEVRIKGAHVPIGLLLGSWLGLDEFFKTIGVKATEYDIATRVDKSKGHIIRFKDVKIQLEHTNLEQLLLINGLRKNEIFLKEIERDTLDGDAGWKVLFTLMGLGRSQQRGIASIRYAWVDAICAKLLGRQGYPTDMASLFLVVNGLLSTGEYQRECDGDLLYIRSYDRVVSLVYRELTIGMNEFDANNSPKRKLTINPRAVKMAILSDGLVSPTEDTSPYNQTRNQTRMGYGGNDGRGERSMVGRHRVFDENDLGIISEAGTDDGKTGTVLNTPVNPNFDSIYGTTKKDKNIEVGNVLSLSALIAPFTLHDEMKRIVFGGIQGNAMIYSEGYRIMPVYTGAGLILAHQVDGNFTHIAKDDGEVVKVTDKYLEVKYKDKTRAKVSLGRGIGRNSGKLMPKKLITDYKPKDKFRKGAVMVWDTNFFDRCMIEPDQVDVYTGSPIIVAIKEEMDVYEDASSISQEVGDTAMSSNIIHIRALSIPYSNNFKLTVKVGDHVSPNTPVAIITPEGVEITDNNLDLDFMSQSTPKAKHGGTIVRIEVNYMGEYKDASPGLKSVIRASNAQFKEEAEFSDVHPNGEVTESTFINQQYLEKDTAVVTIYIEHLDKYSIGDKSSDCNQLKTINGYSWKGDIRTITPDNKPSLLIDAKFSGDAIFARVVTSVYDMGLLNLAMYLGGLTVVAIYRGTN